VRTISLPTLAAATGTLAALAMPVAAQAHSNDADGVRADIKHDGTLVVKGSNQADNIALRLQAGAPTVLQVDVGDDGSADFSLPRAEVGAIDVRLRGGDDTFRVDDVNGNVQNETPLRIGGGRGDDKLTGGRGAETFYGGAGDDFVFGKGGTDTAYLGDGDDVFRWDPGDASDVVEGQGGNDDHLLFNGAAGPEQVTLSANGDRLTFFRVQANITMDTDGVEVVDFNALGGADTATVNDLTGTDVRKVNLDLAGTIGGNAADGAADNVVVNGTNGNDRIAVQGSASGVDVTGLTSTVSIRHSEATALVTDTLAINTLDGADAVFTSGIAGVLKVLVDGQAV
jgi:RTX calcium-binding nonapeptide repeat (4 copies)